MQGAWAEILSPHSAFCVMVDTFTPKRSNYYDKKQKDHHRPV